MNRPYRHPIPDEQVWAEAHYENASRSIVEWRRMPNADSALGINADGDVVMRACGLDRPPNPIRAAQDAMETESQVVGADDEWA